MVGRTALFEVTASRDGAISAVLTDDDSEAPFTNFPQYLADELRILTRNSAYAFQEWKDGHSGDATSCERFRLICCLLIHPAVSLSLTVSKADEDLASIRKIAFVDGEIHYDLTCYPPMGVVANWSYPSASDAVTFDFRRYDTIQREL